MFIPSGGQSSTDVQHNVSQTPISYSQTSWNKNGISPVLKAANICALGALLMGSRKFDVLCFSDESDTREMEGTVFASTAADAVIEFFRMKGLGRPRLPLRVESPEVSLESIVQVWSVSILRMGWNVLIKERIRMGLGIDRMNSQSN